jgi:hypothetical protein
MEFIFPQMYLDLMFDSSAGKKNTLQKICLKMGNPFSKDRTLMYTASNPLFIDYCGFAGGSINLK